MPIAQAEAAKPAKPTKHLAFYLLIMLLFYISDSIMSYGSPVVINDSLADPALMGLVFGFSSLVGFVFDLLASKFFPNKPFSFFADLMFKLVVFFPLTFLLLPSKIWIFLFAMGVWGVYYELSRFAHFNFINDYLSHDQHTKAWSLIGFVQTLGLTLGPIMASYLLSNHASWRLFLVAFVFSISAYLLYLKFVSFLKKHNCQNSPVRKISFLEQLQLWGILLKKLWPLYLFLIVVALLDCAFWVGGPLLIQSSEAWFMKFLLSTYAFSAFLQPFYMEKLSRRFSKKKLAFISGIIGGGLMGLSFLLLNSWWLLVFVFLAGVFTNTVFTAIYATFEDYVARLGYFKNDLIGLQSSAISVAYALGPIWVGFLIKKFNYNIAIASFAGLLLLTSIICLAIVPRKIKMPQKELHDMLE